MCLWLIEHKLTEDEFTTCGGYRSTNNKDREACNDGAGILADHSRCYYQYKCGYRYWQIHDASKLYKPAALAQHSACPFKGGLNQLWRNQLMGKAIEQKADAADNGFERVHFSVVHHPDNLALNDSMSAYRELLEDKNSFNSIASSTVLDATGAIESSELREWTRWYRDLYRILPNDT